MVNELSASASRLRNQDGFYSRLLGRKALFSSHLLALVRMPHDDVLKSCRPSVSYV